MITPGGEGAFVSKMVQESVTLGQRCRYVLSFCSDWYPLVCGPFSQMVHLHARQAVISHCSGHAPARSLGMPGHPETNGTTLMRGYTLQITNYGLTELVQGHTRRWALAWSFTDKRLTDVSSVPASFRSWPQLIDVL